MKKKYRFYGKESFTLVNNVDGKKVEFPISDLEKLHEKVEYINSIFNSLTIEEQALIDAINGSYDGRIWSFDKIGKAYLERLNDLLMIAVPFTCE